MYNEFMPSLSFKDFIFEAFMDFQRDTKKHSVTAFADYLSEHNSFGLSFSQPLVSGWINGDFKASEKYAPALAEILGDKIYEVLEIDRPNPFLQSIRSRWDRIPPDKQKKLDEDARRYEAEALKNGPKDASKQRKTTTP